MSLNIKLNHFFLYLKTYKFILYKLRLMNNERCYKCNKKTKIMMRCTCNKLFCIKHYTPTKHNCTKSIENDKKVNVKDLKPTGAFKKIDKI